MATSVQTAGRATANLAGASLPSNALGMCSVHGIYDFCRLLRALVSPLFLPQLPLLPLLLSLIMPLGSCRLILLCSPITPTHHLTIMAALSRVISEKRGVPVVVADGGLRLAPAAWRNRAEHPVLRRTT